MSSLCESSGMYVRQKGSQLPFRFSPCATANAPSALVYVEVRTAAGAQPQRRGRARQPLYGVQPQGSLLNLFLPH